jgi:hypothetical protein
VLAGQVVLLNIPGQSIEIEVGLNPLVDLADVSEDSFQEVRGIVTRV